MTLKGQSRSSTRSTFKNAQNDQKSHQKASGDVNIQILHLTLTELLKVMPNKGENGLCQVQGQLSQMLRMARKVIRELISKLLQHSIFLKAVLATVATMYLNVKM